MPSDTIAEVTSLLEDAMKVHRAVRTVVLCTREGVVVAAVSRDNEDDSTVLATVSAALTWAGTTTLNHIGHAKPTHLIHSTPVERLLTVIQPHYQLIIAISKADDSGFNLEGFLSTFQSIATRIEILMGGHSSFGKETVLGNIVKAIPEISQALLLTLEGLPIGSVGFENDIEVAALASSIFANGLTFSQNTTGIAVNSKDVNVLVHRVDDKRLVAVVCRGPNQEILCNRVIDILQEV
ncbi:MAG: hypothetical protein ACW97A_11165 [Candidatus Thorarchaeota archaeon]|jgi:predicted regulator of Ras-like GTPase activity (Roadblock/LC7/MglB family)